MRTGGHTMDGSQGALVDEIARSVPHALLGSLFDARQHDCVLLVTGGPVQETNKNVCY